MATYVLTSFLSLWKRKNKRYNFAAIKPHKEFTEYKGLELNGTETDDELKLLLINCKMCGNTDLITVKRYESGGIEYYMDGFSYPIASIVASE